MADVSSQEQEPELSLVREVAATAVVLGIICAPGSFVAYIVICLVSQ